MRSRSISTNCPPDAAWSKLQEQYGLELFEQAQFRRAMALLINLVG